MAEIEQLINQVSEALSKRSESPTENELRRIIRGFADVWALAEPPAFTDDELESALRQLQTLFDTKMSLGSWFFDDTEWMPWWLGDSGRKVGTDDYYWNRYRKLLLTKVSPFVVNSLDIITDKILDYLQDPHKDGNWERKGLVVGHVQSGKTANYIGLISKAADAGYKVIVVLGGMLNSLRNQTQMRIDSDFFGYCTKNKKETGVARFNNSRRPFSLTTSVADFAKATADKVQIDLNALNEPVVFVLKKNVTTLENIKDWLEKGNKRGLNAFPLLLIDDEADHASINTNDTDKDPTKINLGIRKLLTLFPRNSYVGYTATPFANIFIDPDNENQMQNGELYKDLFPRDFILSLDPPSNYIGAEKIFVGMGEAENLRIIDDNEDVIPLHHKKDHTPHGLPKSLERAIDCFMLVKTIRELRKQVGKHHAMMVNVSRFTAVQEQMKVNIIAFLEERKQAIKNYASLPVKEALDESSVLRKLKKVWHEEYVEAKYNYGDVDSQTFSWSEIQKNLHGSVSSITVISLNTKSADRLNYDDYPDGQSLIVIGGMGLSRGLTLEGLSVSYFLRNSIMYDTLLQMGRWFGYRDGYQDLCRIFMTLEAASWYAHISSAVEELRGEFREMQRLGMTPLDFGLKVRSHPAALIVTAKNKMRSALEFVREIALDGRFVETSRLINDKQILDNNRKVFEDAVRVATSEKKPEHTKLGWLWKGVSITILEDIVENFKNSPDCLLTTREPLKEYINWLKSYKHITTCDLLLRSLPTQGEGENLNCAGYNIFAVKRSLERGTIADKRLVFMRRHITSEGDQSAGISDEVVKSLKEQLPGKDLDKKCRKYRAENQMPPLLLLLFATFKDADGKFLTVPAYGISFPGDPGGRKRPEKTVVYTVNRTWYELNYDGIDDYDMEEDEE